MRSVKTFLMFVGEQAGKAEEAIRFYANVFANGSVSNIEHWGAGEEEPESTLKTGTFTLNGVEFMAMDSCMNHQFNFTPSMSLFVECDSRQEIDEAYRVLSEGGVELMAIGDYGFSRRFGWINDRYGVSWQLNLP